jgi:cytochrome c-type biogenesis protein CcsB
MALWGALTLYAIAMVSYSLRLATVTEKKGAAKALARAGAKATAKDASASVEVLETDVAPTDPQDARAERRSLKALGIARSATLVGVVLNGIGVIARGVEAGHVPWSNMYGYAITGAFVSVLVLLILQRRMDVVFLGPLVTGFATLTLGIGLAVLYEAATGLQPALQSYWLVVHVSIAIFATGIFSVGAAASTLQLLRDSRDTGSTALASWRWLATTPTATRLESLSFRLHAVGFVMWTFTVMAGAMWAEDAWGRYWGWDPKEIWSFVIWVVYAAYLHARTTQGWAGRRSAWLAIAGFVTLIMNFTVVNLYFQGLHTYAGS